MTRPLFAEDMDWIWRPGHARKPGRVRFREERAEFRGQKQFQSEVIFKVGVFDRDRKGISISRSSAYYSFQLVLSSSRVCLEEEIPETFVIRKKIN